MFRIIIASPGFADEANYGFALVAERGLFSGGSKSHTELRAVARQYTKEEGP
jgi:hypothetical protein